MLRNRRIASRRQGFTIIELLIVVIVIGVLAAAGIAKYQGFAEKARQSTCLAQQATLLNAVHMWCTQNQGLNENNGYWGCAPFENRTGYAWCNWWGNVQLPWCGVNNWGIADVIRDIKVFTCPWLLVSFQASSLQGVQMGWYGRGCWASCYIFMHMNNTEPWNGWTYYVPYAGVNKENHVLCSSNGLYACNPPVSYKYKHASRWN